MEFFARLQKFYENLVAIKDENALWNSISIAQVILLFSFIFNFCYFFKPSKKNSFFNRSKLSLSSLIRAFFPSPFFSFSFSFFSFPFSPRHILLAFSCSFVNFYYILRIAKVPSSQFTCLSPEWTILRSLKVFIFCCFEWNHRFFPTAFILKTRKTCLLPAVATVCFKIEIISELFLKGEQFSFTS